MNEAAMTAVEEKFSKIEAATAAAEEATSRSSSQSFLGGMAHTIKAVHFDQALRKPLVLDQDMLMMLKNCIDVQDLNDAESVSLTFGDGIALILEFVLHIPIKQCAVQELARTSGQDFETSTSAAPAMTQAAIRQLIADSVAAALEAQDANMANTDNTNRNPKPRETPAYFLVATVPTTVLSPKMPCPSGIPM
nr:cell division cycle 48C [Tanacetum cinerariifolium]